MDAAIQKAINEQIGLELSSAYTYLAMSLHFEEENYPGFAHWMRLQAQEELAHAMKFIDHVLERGGHVALPAVPAPATEFGTPAEVFALGLAQEKEVTASINAIYGAARERKDYATELLLQWFVTEQIEEESTAELAVEQLTRAGDHAPALLLLDRQFGQRSEEG